jgi:transcriptional regulator with XRE-family HTH domain
MRERFVTKRTFPQFIRDRLKEQGINQAELARRSGVSDAHISRVVAGGSAGIEFCVKIAKGFKISPALVLYEASGISFGVDGDKGFEEWRYILSQLPPYDRHELMQIARLKLERQESEKNKVTPHGLPEG